MGSEQHLSNLTGCPSAFAWLRAPPGSFTSATSGPRSSTGFSRATKAGSSAADRKHRHGPRGRGGDGADPGLVAAPGSRRVSRVALEPFSATELPESPDPVAASAAPLPTRCSSYPERARVTGWCGSAQPEVEPVLRGERAPEHELSAAAAGPNASGTGDLVPAPQHRGAERRHAAPEPDRSRARLRAPPEARSPGYSPTPRPPRYPRPRSGSCWRPSGSGRSSPRILPKPSGSPRWRSTGGSTAGWSLWSRLAGPRASARADRGAALRDRAPLAHGLASARQADCPRRSSGGSTSSTRPCSSRSPTCWKRSSGCWSSIIRANNSGAGLLPVRLLGGRRPGRQSLRHQ